MYRATVESRNFDFEAYSKTASNAKATLIRALKLHGKQYKCAPDWYADLLDDIYVSEIKLGQGYRDREPMREQP